MYITGKKENPTIIKCYLIRVLFLLLIISISEKHGIRLRKAKMMKTLKIQKTTILNSKNFGIIIDNYVNTISKYFSIEKKPRGYRKKVKYQKDFSTFDIETTSDKIIEHSFMYSWAFYYHGYTIIGRSWDSFLYFIDSISSKLNDSRLICYIHNASYDWHFISGVYPFEKEDVFFTDPRKVLYAVCKNIEFRCSYMLTGLSLHDLTYSMNVKHKKQSGEKFDYTKLRLPGEGNKNGLKSYELRYIINDVVGLYEALRKLYDSSKETTYTIPLTKTGYVRRDMKKACAKIPYSKRKDWQLDYNSYYACKMAFRGGNTHANRYYCDTIMHDVLSFDFASAYIAVMLYSDHFPKRNFTRTGAISFSSALKAIIKKKYCCIFSVRFTNIELKDRYDGFPYLSIGKMQFSHGVSNDNGRILKAKKIRTYLTDTDLLIVLNQYTFEDVEILDSYMCSGGMLPKEIRDVIFKYYQDKTKLKGITGIDPETGIDYEILYMLAKTKLNASYGCMVMDSCKSILEYDHVDESFSYNKDKSPKELLDAFNKKGFCPFSWGCFVTSICRFWLQSVYNMIDKNFFIYADTDSIKAVNISPEVFKTWNEKMKQKAIDNNVLCKNIKGEVKYLGLFEYEYTAKKLVTLGAKKYCYEDQNGELHLTVAGVGKIKGAKELGSIENFKDGFKFTLAGGTSSKYNDLRPGYDTFDIVRNGIKIHITKNIYISDSEYTLSRTLDYMQLVDMLQSMTVSKEGVYIMT